MRNALPTVELEASMKKVIMDIIKYINSDELDKLVAVQAKNNNIPSSAAFLNVLLNIENNVMGHALNRLHEIDVDDFLEFRHKNAKIAIKHIMENYIKNQKATISA